MVNVLAAEATIRHVLVDRRIHLEDVTFLSLVVWVRNVAFEKSVFVDVHVLEEGGKRLSRGTYGLGYRGSEGGGGDGFVLDQAVYAGTVHESARSLFRGVAAAVLARVYYEVGGRLYSDGTLHQLRPSYVSWRM